MISITRALEIQEKLSKKFNMRECFNTLYKVTDNTDREYFIIVEFHKIEMVFDKFNDIRDNEKIKIIEITFICHDVINTVNP